MTPEAQRITIAEACGWQCVCLESYSDGRGGFDYGPRGMPPKHNLRRELPDYLDDLNAMHEAEEGFMSGNSGYWSALLLVTDRVGRTMDWRHFGHATAAQRAEAFLRTLGEWPDGTTSPTAAHHSANSAIKVSSSSA